MNDKKLIEIIQTVLYGKKIDDLPSGDTIWDTLLEAASRNRVLYYFASQVESNYRSCLSSVIRKKIEMIISEGNIWQERLKNTLLFIKDNFSKYNILYLIVKTKRNIPYVTYDVDVLIREEDFLKVKEILNAEGQFTKHPGKQSKNQINFFGNDLLTIDIHKDFTWQGFRYLEKDIVWKKYTNTIIASIEVPIPTSPIEFILYVAHLVYERRYITLLDLNNLVDLSNVISDYSTILEQTEQFGWKNSFLNLISILNSLSYHIYPYFRKVLPLSTEELKISEKGFEMPYFIPSLHVLSSFKEKIVFERKIPYWDIAYYIYTTFRYHISGKKRFPYYIDWLKK